MNKAYRLIWSKARERWEIAAEIIAGKGGPAGVTVAALVGVSLALGASGAHALPAGGQLAAGQAAISTPSGSQMNISQGTSQAIINWNSFSIAKGETVSIVQPSSSATLLNRVLGNDPSQILGSLTANGRVFLVNPGGVLFAPGASVNVGGLVASGLNIKDGDFLAGKFSFFQEGPAASVVNQGKLTGGFVALLGSSVENAGSIITTRGTTGLAAGGAITLGFDPGGLMAIKVDAAAYHAQVKNSGIIEAAGGTVLMTAAAADALLATVVNNSGVVRAGNMVERGGEIVLEGAKVVNSGTLEASGLAGDGGRITLHASGSLSVTGSIRADAAPDSSGKGGTISLVASLANPGSLAQIDGGISARAGNQGGDGGFVETSAARLQIGANTSVNTLAAHGKSGTWLIDPVDFTIAAAGGNMTGAALSDGLTRGNVSILSSSGTSGTSGDVNINDVVVWSANKLTLNAQNNININASLNGSGGASLALEYGQQAAAAGNSSEVVFRAPVNLTDGPHFSTKLGSDGAVKNFTVITTLGLAGSVTGSDLQGMQGDLTANYALGGDIDATGTSGWNAGAGFTPVGSVSNSFAGSLNGLGHTISNLTINQPSSDYLGLIGMALSSVQISNLALTGVSVQGHNEIGGLVGWNEGTVANCSMTGSVNGLRFVGGLVGENNFGKLIDNYATGSVNGLQAIGGLSGTNHGTVSNCYATGAVSGIAEVGGLVGSASSGVISNSYATGSVQGDDSVGGLAGDSQGTIRNSYATGNVSGLREVGGLVGLYQGGAVIDSFWDTTATGQATSAGGGTGLSSAQMMQLASFSDWNANAPNTIANTGGSGAVWRIYEGHTAPLLASFLTGVTLTDAPDVVASYTSNAQSGASTVLGGVSGAAATGTKAGFYNGYYSSQQGYDITGGNLTINRASLTVSGTTVADKVYDATPTAILVGTAAITALGSDDVTLGGSGSAAFLDKNVGTGKSVTIAGYTISGSDAGNYTLVQPAGLSANITPADLTVSGLSAAGKVYDGNRTASLSGSAVISKLGTDDVSLGGSGSGSFADKNFGTGKAVAVTGYTISGSDAGNYHLVQPTGVVADISKAHLTVTADDKTRAYGAANPTLTTTLSGFVNGENVSTAAVGGTGSATTAATPSTAVGTAVITAGAGSLSATNYDFTTLVNGTLTISSVPNATPPAPVTPTPAPPSAIPIAPAPAPTPPAPPAPVTTISSALSAPTPVSPIRREAPAIAVAPPPVIIPAAPEAAAPSNISFVSADAGESAATGQNSSSPSAPAYGSGQAGFLSTKPLAWEPTSSSFIYPIPEGTFPHSDPNAAVVILARMEDGSSLPPWMLFDPVHKIVSGTAPRGTTGAFRIRLIARDQLGQEAVTILTITIGG